MKIKNKRITRRQLGNKVLVKKISEGNTFTIQKSFALHILY
jgi:hypothetical protein